jgi:hypothetical protein
MRSTVIAGHPAGAEAASVVRMAAPSGVTSSERTPVIDYWKAAQQLSGAGAGHRHRPCGPSTNPPPSGNAETWTFSTRAVQAMTAPVTSTIASTAPTSWK